MATDPALPRTLVLGGARSGKSTTAERLLARYEDVLYVATSGTRDDDTDWAQRVALHRDRRPAGWRTAETCALEAVLADDADPAPVLIDCLALWLTAVMDECGAWDDAVWTDGGEAAVQARCEALAAAWAGTGRQVIAVSNEVGMGVVPATAAGRRFRDTLGRLNMAVADASERVLLVVAGQALTIKSVGV
ncbi:bifunctional adenosylcobinamide kinase/adenosylcobinamide-phosphate guanylyltransferase [Streptomyces sp. CB01881]|uniref:bifunctional adenosylcobinamide kinase/adenosylcobinamide-phosphate guanylyltransferase n=1 Tax=Streptomyces sp. CB01881 TaxID=2078691 RepID=UPI000CDC486B|nr:bifunctional adenosylcobinamide kinase/adenosylcobinamide-phosphate guanylyltransferase [Streptomyces sp. CB01881]TYC71500.1 bifunctional adenosylcobinamide kinase/adenosylcobinamide-phosphate guanylyltransferase [Streptomyces sp. CB01881]